MRAWIRLPLARVGSGTVLAVLAWGLFAPASARASCGDYVTMQPRHSSTQQTSPQHRPPPHLTPPQGEPDAPPVANVVPPCPCREPAPSDGLPLPCPGPGCSAPTAPDSTTAPAPVQHPDDWAVPAGAVCFAPSTPVDSFADLGRGHPVRQPSAIYHPPRSPRAQ